MQAFSFCEKALANLAIQNSTKIQEVQHNLAIHVVYQPRIMAAFISSDPPNIPHGSVVARDMKLVLDADWEAVKCSQGSSALLKLFVEVFCPLYCLIKKYLMQAIVLRGVIRD
jgi:hypothetical protein